MAGIPAAFSSVRDLLVRAQLDPRNGLVCSITPGATRVASTRIVAATTSVKRSRSQAMCSKPLSSGTTVVGVGFDPFDRFGEARGLGGDEEDVRGLVEGFHGAHCRCPVTEETLRSWISVSG